MSTDGAREASSPGRGGGPAAGALRAAAAPAVALALTALAAPAPAQQVEPADTLDAGEGRAPAADSLPAGVDPLEPGAVAPRAAPQDTLSLEDALRTALSHNPELRGQRAQASAAHAARLADWGAFLPTASAGMTLARSDVTRNTFVSEEGIPRERSEQLSFVSKSANQSLTFSWDLLRGGRRFTALEAGGAAVEAADRRLDQAQRRVAAEVKQSYFEAAKQGRLVEIARRQLENRRRELEQTRRRYRIAAVDRADLLGARVAVREAEVTLLDARDAAAAARRELRVALGRDTAVGDTDFALRPVAAPPEPDSIRAPALVRSAVRSHPELRALQAEIDRASAGVWEARSRYLPTITLSYSHRRHQNLGREGALFTLDPGDRTDGLSISARWELFTGFQRREENARASAQLRQARAERARRRLEIRKTVRDLVDEVERRSRRVDLLRDQLEIAEERLELLSEQYRLGSAGFDQLQRAIDDVTRAERNLVGERYDYLSAWARLERWAGDVAPGLPSPAVDAGSGAGRDGRAGPASRAASRHGAEAAGGRAGGTDPEGPGPR